MKLIRMAFIAFIIGAISAALFLHRMPAPKSFFTGHLLSVSTVSSSSENTELSYDAGLRCSECFIRPAEERFGVCELCQSEE